MMDNIQFIFFGVDFYKNLSHRETSFRESHIGSPFFLLEKRTKSARSTSSRLTFRASLRMIIHKGGRTMDASYTGEKISELRKEKGLTQKDLAELLNVTNKAVSKWECGDSFC